MESFQDCFAETGSVNFSRLRPNRFQSFTTFIQFGEMWLQSVHRISMCGNISPLIWGLSRLIIWLTGTGDTSYAFLNQRQDMIRLVTGVAIILCMERNTLWAHVQMQRNGRTQVLGALIKFFLWCQAAVLDCNRNYVNNTRLSDIMLIPVLASLHGARQSNQKIYRFFQGNHRQTCWECYLHFLHSNWHSYSQCVICFAPPYINYFLAQGNIANMSATSNH